MKKIKKLLAMIMAMTMVLGMAMTVSAANPVEIQVSGAGENAKFQWLQLIKPDPTQETGWAFTDESIRQNFSDAFDRNSSQDLIWMLLLNQDETIEIPDWVNVQPATDSQIAKALANVRNGDYTLEGPNSTITVDDAGMYYIMGDEEGYTYSPMAAYVSFRYNDNGEVADELYCAGVVAKKVPNDVEIPKSGESKHKLTEIDRTETFTVGPAVVPYIYTDADKEYFVRDTITGGEYVTVESGEHEGEVELTVIVGRDTKTFYGTVTNEAPAEDGRVKQSFEANLSSILEGNKYANQDITITYQAVVKDVKVGNTVTVGDAEGDTSFGHGDTELYTATINLLKYASDNDNDNLSDNKKLAGAEFIVYKVVEEAGTTKTYYAVANGNEFTNWTTDKEKATHLISNEDGKVSLSGLGAGTYWFEEVKAPTGYSLNGERKSVEVKTTEDLEDVLVLTPINFLNDKLAALPSTGGIGTTIFTIGGCAIMIAAAALYFVNRRKSEEN